MEETEIAASRVVTEVGGDSKRLVSAELVTGMAAAAGIDAEAGDSGIVIESGSWTSVKLNAGAGRQGRKGRISGRRWSELRWLRIGC